MKDLSISNCISVGWEQFKKYGLSLTAIYLGYYVVSNILTMPLNLYNTFQQVYTGGYHPYESYPISILAAQGTNIGIVIGCSLLAAVFGLVFYFGFYGITLQLAKGTLSAVSFNPFKRPVIAYLKFFAVTIIYGLAVGVGCCLCIIPGIYLAIKLNFAPIYMVDHPDATIEKAMSAGWKMSKGNFWSILGLQVAFIGITFVGFLCCCIGVLAANPYIFLIESNAYYELLGNIEPDGYNPTDNYSKEAY